MDDDLRFLAALVKERSDRLRDALQDRRGRGSTFASTFVGVCDQLSKVAVESLNEEPRTGRELQVRVRGLLRSRQQLGLMYRVVAHFENDIGRRDLPVGLLYLIDEIVRDLLPQSADPLVHLDDRYMYSTLPLLETLPELLKPEAIDHPHPVAFNLPGLDPANAMLAPILAHEVGHTSWRQGTATILDSRIDEQAVRDALDPAISAGEDPADLAKTYASWCQELMCDALAATLTGPSFLFSSAVFLPAPGLGGLGSHPYQRDRIALTLRILERYGWTETLERLSPRTLAWCTDLVSRPELSGHPRETALRNAMAVVESELLQVAEDQCSTRLRVEDFVGVEAVLLQHIEAQVPPVELANAPATPWMIVCGAWFGEIAARGDDPSALPLIAADSRVNRFALKAVELAAIAASWSDHEPAAS
jgi:hypothetical protein